MRIATDRRGFVLGAAAFAAAGVPSPAKAAGRAEAAAVAAVAHDFAAVAARARTLANAPYVPPEATLPPPFDDLTAERHAAITPAVRLQLGAAQVEPLPPGYVYRDPVAIDLVDGRRAQPLRFAPDLFRFHTASFSEAPDAVATADFGFSGFRLLDPGGGDVDRLEFQGASQFRGRHRGGIYGASARGLAIATASSAGEEVPRFVRFWIDGGNPGTGAGTVVVHALLDSPSVAGAFAFGVRPGADTAVDVHCRLYPRTDLAAVGIAPLSSMHLFGTAGPPVDDVRDAVHDSDGLQIITGRGERLWRPLTNPRTLQLSGFVDDNPRAFGLTQRARDFARFGDAEAGFERRPSVWVEPRGDWGRGQVVLVEIPLPSEANDNIVAFWRPDGPLAAGVEHAFDYRVTWAPLPDDPAPLARVAATRSGAGTEGSRRFAIDFDRSAAPAGELTPRLSLSRGSFHGLGLTATPDPARVRVQFVFVPDGADISEFRLVLHAGDAPASETWLHRWTAA